MHGCPLTPGSYICELTGPAVACRAPHNAAATLSVSAQTQISMAAIKGDFSFVKFYLYFWGFACGRLWFTPCL